VSKIVKRSGILSAVTALNGSLYTMDGGRITRELWANMVDFNTTDPAV